MRITDDKIIETARKYDLVPGKIKCLAYLLFDLGHSPREARFLLRNNKEVENPKTLSKTINKYHYLWLKAQNN